METLQVIVFSWGSIAFLGWIYWLVAYPEEVWEVLRFQFWSEGTTDKFATLLLWVQLFMALGFLGVASSFIYNSGLL